MLEELRSRLQSQIEEFDRELRVELPKRIATAVALGDLRENAEYSSALERQEFVRARLAQLTRRQSELSSIDLRDVPRDSAGFGSQVALASDDGERSSLRIVFPEFVDMGDEMISIASPLGRALIGARPGQRISLATPSGNRAYVVLEVTTLHGETLTAEGS
ncbi:MAG TPA: GreA/GreB family elongation factor [Gemmatimonadota bacterium]|jgi:transcription elongation factor GreA|nr:GreA/GreB family elongation factor [Gemmatimonadota bacterium]